MAQKQPTQAELQAAQKLKNETFMSLSYVQEVLANAQNGNQYSLGKNLQYDSPIIASAYATKVTLRANLVVNWTPGTTGTVTPTASYPYSLLGNQVVITYGSKVATFHPYLAKLKAMIEGYNRGEFDNSKGFKASRIDDMLRKVPTTLSPGANTVKFDVDYELNAIHPVSINGILPIFSSGVRLQTNVNLPSAISAEFADALDHAFEVKGDGAVSISGSVETIISYRDNRSMTTRQNLEPDLNGIPTVNVVQLPSAMNLSQGAFNHVRLANPYPFTSIFHIICDGNQADVFAKADNITGYTLDMAENSNSAFLRYDETNGGIVNLYKRQRDKFGQDLPEGTIVHSFETDNLANVSSKTGGAWLNITGQGYPASRFGVKLNSVNNTDRVSKIISYGVILNGEGIQTR